MTPMRSSIAWNYFSTKEGVDNYVFCNFCWAIHVAKPKAKPEEVKLSLQGGGTASLWNHLRHEHNSKWAELQAGLQSDQYKASFSLARQGVELMLSMHMTSGRDVCKHFCGEENM